KVPPIVVFYHGLYLAEACVDLGARRLIKKQMEALPPSPFPTDNIRLRTAKGRAYIGVGRSLLQQAVPPIDIEPDALDQESIGLSLMAAGGEDLDPNSFALRRRQLERATELLEGERRVRCAALKDRLLEGPGAALDQIVRLVEAVGQGDKLLEVVAQIVSDALGAHRVLVMLRLPGLGRQLTAREISGQESAGLAPEIWRRVRRPDDVWLAGGAFADPGLRRRSATVRNGQVEGVVAVAIPKGGKAIGALYVDDIHRAGRFGPADVDVLKRIARAIGDVADALPTVFF
ncbi:MAG: GAF domain-containing protein, partial [Myxococcota bacterium]